MQRLYNRVLHATEKRYIINAFSEVSQYLVYGLSM
jgi:hypothetical protein